MKMEMNDADQRLFQVIKECLITVHYTEASNAEMYSFNTHGFDSDFTRFRLLEKCNYLPEQNCTTTAGMKYTEKFIVWYIPSSAFPSAFGILYPFMPYPYTSPVKQYSVCKMVLTNLKNRHDMDPLDYARERLTSTVNEIKLTEKQFGLEQLYRAQLHETDLKTITSI